MTSSTSTQDDPRPEAERVARGIRLRAVRMIEPQGFGYLGQALSSAETVAVLYSHYLRPGLDRFICSPGHYIIAAYAAAAEVGLITDDELLTYGQDGSSLEAIGTERTPLVDLTCGSLAQGLSGAAGFALADRLRGIEDRNVYALISDGELEEGQTWEAALFAAHHGLGGIVAILDANNSQVDGPIDSITTIEPIAAKWESFGWHTQDIDGHDLDQVIAAYAAAVVDPRPSIIIARTSTVHGIAALPADADGHFIKLPADLATAAIEELENA